MPYRVIDAVVFHFLRYSDQSWNLNISDEMH
jgi:hypothetical protein